MIKYTGYSIVLQEVPDEISLAIEISNCQHRCPGCHSPELQKNVGYDLEQDLPTLLKEYAGRITCVCFMGEGNDRDALARCLMSVRKAGLKTCLYSGSQVFDLSLQCWIDYYKIGPYIEERGGLDSPGTNQSMWLLSSGKSGMAMSYTNITYKFQHRKG